MLPENIMLVQFRHSFCMTLKMGLLGLGLFSLTGCQPPGPKALLEGERLIHEARFDQAVERLHQATELLPNNAQAWNHLGIALQGLGKSDAAVAAYQHALRLDRNLGVARFNLGWLHLENNRPAEAANELTTYTTLVPTATTGWFHLGTAFLRQKKWDDAERALAHAYRLDAKDPEILNNLGVVCLQKRKTREAGQWFSQALKVKPGHPPALLNFAIVSHFYFNAKPLALEQYRQYVALVPEPSNAANVRELIKKLEAELQPKPVVTPAPIVPTVTTPPPPQPLTSKIPVGVTPTPLVPKIAPIHSQPVAPPQAVAIVKPSLPIAPPVQPPVVTNLVTLPIKGVPPPNPVAVAPEVAAAPKLEVVRVTDDFVPPRAKDVVETKPRTNNTPPDATAPAKPSPPLVRSAQRDPAKEPDSFWKKNNPIKWFSQKIAGPEPTPRPTGIAVTTVQPQVVTPPPPRIILRYPFTVRANPLAGNRAAAEKFFHKGLESHQTQRFGEAAAGYQEALALDPVYFEAAYNLGLVGYQTRNWSLALASGEAALKIDPASLNARYNFALTLEAAGYYLDAVDQLEQGIKIAPPDARLHLAAASIYSVHLTQPAAARDHYRRVLALLPNHPKAEEIRRWLGANP